MNTEDIQLYLTLSSSHHSHLCPRQVLGVRIALAGLVCLGLEPQRKDKRLLVTAETDGCFIDGLAAVTGASAGHRTLRVEDYGKIAATFVDVKTEQAVRVAPQPDIREKSWRYAPGETRHYFAQLAAYRVMPTHELLNIEEVALVKPIASIISQMGARVVCSSCGEEIFNDRQVYHAGAPFCLSCAGASYYRKIQDKLTRALAEPGPPHR
ncbi:MAG: formylmethanofuran dehydrogenase [Chloroflexota bacterium]|nr:MAG: formylmethanofuran dehydrogenase [Chloroflexota bacterium]